MRLALNRLISILPRIALEFSQAGICTLPFGCLDSEMVDVYSNPILSDFDKFDEIIVTSPEAAKYLVNSIGSGLAKWPEDQTIWTVGETTASLLRGINTRVQCAIRPGSHALISEIVDKLHQNSRVLVACGLDSGRQFDALNQFLSQKVSYLELYRTIYVDPVGDLAAATHILHGSLSCLKAYLALRLNDEHLIHIVTSDQARSHLATGSRYHQIEAPTVDQVVHALRGNISVK